MTLEQLRIFIAVAEREHMTRAAEAVGLTQSAVSGAIQALEARHRIALFNRVGRRVELTQEGRVFMEQARVVLRSVADAENSLLELRGLKRGIVHIHASQTIGAYWLPERIAQFHREFPEIELRLSLGNTDQVAKALSAGQAEIGLIEGLVDQPDLVTDLLDLDQLVVVVGSAHPYARLRKLDLKRIAQGEWILRERGSGTRSVFEQALAQLGLPAQRLNVVMEMPSNEAIRAAVEGGMGMAAMSRAVVAQALRSKRLIELNFVRLERPFMLLTQRERSLTHAAGAFADFLRRSRKLRSAVA